MKQLTARCRDCGSEMTSSIDDNEDPYEYANQQYGCQCGNKNWEIRTNDM